MSEESKSLRGQAADSLRTSRKKETPKSSSDLMKARAAGLKALAAEQEWLEGEKERSRTHPKA